MRIAIVGGGMAGMSAAYFLRAAGHRSIVVFERETRVGGKCCSPRLDGHVFEMGAAVVGPGYRNVRELLRVHGLETQPISVRGKCGFYELASAQRREFSRWERAKITAWVGQFYWRRWRSGDWARPGFGHLAPELAEPFGAWLARHGLSQVEPWLGALLTGYGYGYTQEVPAAYALRYLEPVWTVPSMLGHTLPIVTAGYQTLIERMAQDQVVRLGVAVRRLKPGAPLRLEFSDGREEEFDRVIVAGGPPPPEFFAEVDPERAQAMSRVRRHVYHAVATSAPGLPASVIYVKENFERARGNGRMVFSCQRWPEHSPIAVMCGLAGETQSDAAVVAALRDDAVRLGARPGAVLAHRRWDYFPHVGPEDFAAGFHRRLEEAQGRHGIYLAGELMNFPTVEQVCAYSRALVRTHFAAK